MQSTRLDQLPPPNEMSDPQTRDVVLDILDEVRQENDRYMGDPDMMSQQQQRSTSLDHHPQQYSQQPPPIPSLLSQQQYIPKKNDIESLLLEEDDEPKSFVDSIYTELKESGLYLMLFILFNLPFMVYILSKYVPWMINHSTGSATFTGLLVRSIFSSILFYIIKKFIL